MRRAVRLLAAQDEAERQIMTELATKSLTAEAIRTILAEMLRRELRGILAEQAAPLRRTNAEIEARVEELQSEINRLRREARRSDFHAVEYAVRDAALTKAVPLPETIEPDLGREAMDLVRDVRSAQMQIEDGEEPMKARRDSVKKVGDTTANCLR